MQSTNPIREPCHIPTEVTNAIAGVNEVHSQNREVRQAAVDCEFIVFTPVDYQDDKCDRQNKSQDSGKDG